MFRKIFLPLILVMLYGLGGVSFAKASPEGPIDENEPNNTSQQAQTLSVIGRENYVNAAISPAGDQDWYKFNAEAGVTYVVELFEVSASVNNAAGYLCNGAYGAGVGLIVYDASITEIAASCEPNDHNSGAGNVHNILEFTVGVSGIYYIHTLGHHNSVTGNYKLRILPDYTNPIASWDENYEPNNRRSTAAQIIVGRENALSTDIEQRIVNYATNFVDVDWYRFDANADQTYTIELFNVDISFNNAAGYSCNGQYGSGIGLIVYDATGTDITASCEPNDNNAGSGNIHNILQFTPGLPGTYFIKVIPHHEDLNGEYSLRVLPQYDQPGTSWDTQFEPNNRRLTAAEILVGRENAIATNVEERIINYATNFVDVDWYHFEANAGQTYTIELFNIDISFNNAAGYSCNGSFGAGVGLIVYDATGVDIAASCEPNDYNIGSGNVHNILQFTPGLAGTYFIKVIPHQEDLNGNYSLRVLPQYDQPGSSWDTQFEPNNKPHTAYLLSPGQPLTSDIETRLANYATNFVDRDWYRIDALAGEAYIIETFNVSNSLAVGSGSLCQGATRTGLGILIYDPTLSTILIRQCSVNGTGNVHTTITFVPDISGTYYIWILPNSSTVSGSYSVRLGGVDKVYLPMVKR